MPTDKKIQIIKPLLSDSYLVIIKNSVDSKIWRRGYVLVNGKRTEIYRNGQLSCAFFVSSILRLFDLIDEVHATVAGTIKDLKKNRWQKVRKPSLGDILIWQEIEDRDGLKHAHIGFYIGGKQAISNSSRARSPQKHHWTYNNKRNITAIYHRDM